MTVLLGLLASLTCARADELPLPAAPSLGGLVDLSAGFALVQLPAIGHHAPNPLGRFNGHATGMLHFGPHLSGGLHLAAWSVPYAPLPGLRTNGLRVEPRFGIRVAQGRRLRVDLNLGIALDFGEQLLPGPVVSGTGRYWPGPRPGRGLFLLAEVRAAPVVIGVRNDIDCGDMWCDNRMTYNPGGTGLLVGAGGSVPRSGRR